MTLPKATILEMTTACFEHYHIQFLPEVVDFETTLAIERFIETDTEHRLMSSFFPLFSRSPVRPFNVSPSDYLAALFAPDEWVLVGDPTNCYVMWESEASRSLVPCKDVFWPNVIDRTRLGAAPIHTTLRPQEYCIRWKYAAMMFDTADIRRIFPDIVEGRWPVSAVISVGEHQTEILFRVEAATESAWNRQRKALSAALLEIAPHRSKITEPAKMPCPLLKQRLVYLRP